MPDALETRLETDGGLYMIHYHPTRWERDERKLLTGWTRESAAAYRYYPDAVRVGERVYHPDNADPVPCRCANGEKALEDARSLVGLA